MDICANANGTKMFTFSDRAIHTWHINTESFETEMNRVTPNPFMNILEGESEKSRYREMEDYFFYMQIKR